jgi:hypothetical protein
MPYAFSRFFGDYAIVTITPFSPLSLAFIFRLFSRRVSPILMLISLFHAISASPISIFFSSPPFILLFADLFSLRYFSYAVFVAVIFAITGFIESRPFLRRQLAIIFFTIMRVIDFHFSSPPSFSFSGFSFLSTLRHFHFAARHFRFSVFIHFRWLSFR